MSAILDRDNFNWEQFFDGPAFEEISKCENRVWIVDIQQDIYSEDITMEGLAEIDASLRNYLLSADSYIEYSKIDKRKKNDSFDHKAVRYRFVEKIIDHKNNLIIVAEEEYFKYGATAECD